jgi:cytochrome c-type biogenesis protein CcmH/NrfG
LGSPEKPLAAPKLYARPSGNGWNELGHAHRRLNQLEPALVAYGKALKIDPKHRGAREYLGEAYLQMNDLLKASIAAYKRTKLATSTR